MVQRQQILEQISGLTSDERESLLFELSREPFLSPSGITQWLQKFPTGEFPSIVSTPQVCGGAARLIRTRIPVWTLVRMRQLGISESDILQSYPTLQALDLVQAWSYAARHRDEIEQSIRENEEE